MAPGNTAANWNTPAAVPGTAAAIIFDGTGINLDTTTNAAFASIRSMTFTAGQTSHVIINTTAGLSNMTTGTGLRFNPGTVFTVAAGDHRIVGTDTSGSGVDRDITLNGSAGTDTYTFDGGGGASLEINARIGNGLGTNSPSRNYSKTGNGTLILSCENGSSGGWNFNSGGLFTVSQGVLRLSGQSSFGNSGNSSTISNDAAMERVGDVTQVVNNGVVTLSGTCVSSTGAIRGTSGSNAISGAGTGGIVLAAASSIGVDAGSSLAIAPGISGALPLTKVGTGALTLTGANTYTGNTTVNAGTLDLSGASSGTPVIFNLFTMLDSTTQGALGTWNQNMNHTWSGFVTTTGGVTSFASNKFSINDGNFDNPINGSFTVVQNGNNLDLQYVAVPGPGTIALLAAGAIAGLVALGRCRKPVTSLV